METDEKKPAVIALKKLQAIFGLFRQDTKQEERLERKTIECNISDSERAALTYWAKEDGRNERKEIPIDNVQSILQTNSDFVSKKIGTMESFNTVLPEAATAESVLVSSILSPSDMYSRTCGVVINPERVTNDELRTTLSKILEDYINKTLDLGDKLQAWIGDALFRKGATAVMVIPRNTVRILADKSLADRKEKQENGKQNMWLGLENVGPDLVVDDVVSTESVNINAEDSKALVLSTEAVTLDDVGTSHLELCSGDFTEKDLGAIGKGLLEKCKANVAVSLEYTKIKSSEERKKDVANAIDQKLNDILLPMGTGHVLAVKDTQLTDKDSNDEPVVIRIPTSSLFPIIVPGAPEEKLGYVVAIDTATGTPINADSVTLDQTLATSTQFLKQLEGTNCACNVKNEQAAKQARDSVQMFDIVMQGLLGGALKNVDISACDLPGHEHLASVLFNRVLTDNKVSLIFVKASSMGYYAYKLRANGTGKTLLEDAEILIALRLQLMTAKVMNAITSATDTHVLTYELDDASSSNVKQMNTALKTEYANKYSPKLSTNVPNILRDYHKNSFRIIPKGMEGLKSFDLKTDISQRRGGDVNTELEDYYTKMIGKYFMVPQSALDDTSNIDKARSLATSSTLFSNDLRLLQKITNRESTVIMRMAAKNSATVMKQFLEAIKANPHEQFSKGNVMEEFGEIIDNASVTLPPPNVVADKARLSEISDQIRQIGEIVDAVWPDDLVVNETDREAKSVLVALRANIKQEKIREIIEGCGAFGVTDIPSLSSVDLEAFRKDNQTVDNLVAMLKDIHETSKKPVAEGGSGSGGYGRY